MPCTGSYNGQDNPVEGGHEEDGTPLWIAQADYEGGVYPGKAGPKLEGANIGASECPAVVGGNVADCETRLWRTGYAGRVRSPEVDHLLVR